LGYVRLFHRVRLVPGVTLNLAKRGASVSLGVRGAHLTVGRTGIRRTVGIPGSGIFYTTHDGWHSGAHTGQPFHEAAGELRGFRRVAHDLLVIFLAFFGMVIALAVLGAIFSH
jgi:Protein of unknown function (DUF4236)